MPTPPPAKPSFATAALDAVLNLFVGLFLQVGRGFSLLVRKVQRSSARRAATAAAVRLGEKMAETEMGNPLLVRAAVAADKRARPAAMEQLGHSGLEVGVPPLGLESEYTEGRDARAAAAAVERAHANLVTSLWPSSVVGWIALGINSVAVVFGLLLLWAWVAPGSAPGFAVNLITKPTPPPALPVATFEGLEVRVTNVVLSRRQVVGKIGDQTVTMSDNAPTLVVSLSIKNTGGVPITVRTWRDEGQGPRSEPARMVDNRAATVRPLLVGGNPTPVGGIPGTTTLAPGQEASDVLLFGAPEAKFQSLELYLPGENVGKPAGVKLLIPAAVVDKPEND